jgi:hypothetical protein
MISKTPRDYCSAQWRKILINIVFLASVSLLSTETLAAPDNILGNFNEPLRMLHMYSTADGSTRVDEITLPFQKNRIAPGTTTIFEGTSSFSQLVYMHDGDKRDYHYAPTTVGRIVLVLQGNFFYVISENKEILIPPGTLFYPDDTRGQGHGTRCEAKDLKKVCLLLLLDFPDAQRMFLLPKP